MVSNSEPIAGGDIVGKCNDIVVIIEQNLLRVVLTIDLKFQDLVVDGDCSKAVDVSEEMAAKKTGYPPIQLVRRDEAALDMPSTSGTVVRTVHDGKLHTLNEAGECNLMKLDHEPAESNTESKEGETEQADFPDDDEVFASQPDAMPTELQRKDPVEDEAEAKAAAQPQAGNQVKIADEIEVESEVAKDKQPVEEEPMQIGDDDEIPDPEKCSQESKGNDDVAKEKLDAEAVFKEINEKGGNEVEDEIDVISKLPAHKLPRGSDDIISGNIGGPSVKVIFLRSFSSTCSSVIDNDNVLMVMILIGC